MKRPMLASVKIQDIIKNAIQKMFICSLICILCVGCSGKDSTVQQTGELDSFDYDLYQGVLLERGGLYDEALDVYNRVLESEPENVKAGWYKYVLEKELKAKAQVQYLDGLILEKSGRFDLAKQSYNRALTIWPSHEQAGKKISLEKRSFIVHEVRSGHSISKIASMYYGTYENYKTISKFNQLKDDTRLEVGQKLKIPEIDGVSAVDLERINTALKKGVFVHNPDSNQNVQMDESISKTEVQTPDEVVSVPVDLPLQEVSEIQVDLPLKRIPSVPVDLPLEAVASVPAVLPSQATGREVAESPLQLSGNQVPVDLPAEFAQNNLPEKKDYVIHCMSKNETISEVANAYYGTSKVYPEILKFNAISDAKKIDTGDLIKMPVMNGRSKEDLIKNGESYIVSLTSIKRGGKKQKSRKKDTVEVKPAPRPDPPAAPSEKPGSAGSADKNQEPPAPVAPSVPPKPSIPDRVTVQKTIEYKDAKETHLEAGLRFIKDEEYEKAIDELKQVETKNPSASKAKIYLCQAYYNQGLFLFEKEDYLNAKQYFETAYATDSKCRDCLEYSRESLEAYKESHYTLGVTSFSNENLDDAIMHWELVYTVDRDYKDVALNIKKARLIRKKLERIKKSELE